MVTDLMQYGLPNLPNQFIFTPANRLYRLLEDINHIGNCARIIHRTLGPGAASIEAQEQTSTSDMYGRQLLRGRPIADFQGHFFQKIREIRR